MNKALFSRMVEKFNADADESKNLFAKVVKQITELPTDVDPTPAVALELAQDIACLRSGFYCLEEHAASVIDCLKLAMSLPRVAPERRGSEY